MCVKYFERELMVDLVKSEKIHNFWIGENSLLKKRGRGDVKYRPYPGMRQESQDTPGKRESKICVLRGAESGSLRHLSIPYPVSREQAQPVAPRQGGWT